MCQIQAQFIWISHFTSARIASWAVWSLNCWSSSRDRVLRCLMSINGSSSSIRKGGGVGSGLLSDSFSDSSWDYSPLALVGASVAVSSCLLCPLQGRLDAIFDIS
jgi:hypothetical protein